MQVEGRGGGESARESPDSEKNPKRIAQDLQTPQRMATKPERIPKESSMQLNRISKSNRDSSRILFEKGCRES